MKVLGKLLNTHFLSHQMLEEDCFLLLEFLQEKNIKQFFLSTTVKGDDGNCRLQIVKQRMSEPSIWT